MAKLQKKRMLIILGIVVLLSGAITTQATFPFQSGWLDSLSKPQLLLGYFVIGLLMYMWVVSYFFDKPRRSFFDKSRRS